MAKNPQDRELKDRFVTTRDNLPADHLQAKRLQALDASFLDFAKLARDVIDDGYAKDQMFDAFERAHMAMRYAIEHPGLTAPELTGGAVVPALPRPGDDTGEHAPLPAVGMTNSVPPVETLTNSIAAVLTGGQAPPDGTGLG